MNTIQYKTRNIEITGFDGIHYSISEMFGLMASQGVNKLERFFQDQKVRITHNTWWAEWTGVNLHVSVYMNPIAITVKYQHSTPKMYSNTTSRKSEALLIENLNYYLKNHWITNVKNKTGIPVESVIFNFKELCGDSPQMKPRPILTPLQVPAPKEMATRILPKEEETEHPPNDNPSVIPPTNLNYWQYEKNLLSDEQRNHVFFLETLADSRKTVKDLDDILRNHGEMAIERWANDHGPDGYARYNWYGYSLHIITTVKKWEILDGGKERWIPIEERPFRLARQMEKLVWIAPYIETWRENYTGNTPVGHVRACLSPTCVLFTSENFIPVLDGIHDNVLSKHADYESDDSYG